jgi:hypothetical protein
MVESEPPIHLTLVYGFFGIVLGVILTTTANWYTWQAQQDLEQKNVAQALYFDISRISDRFNSTFDMTNSAFGDLYRQNKHFYFTEIIFNEPEPYYKDNGLYFTYLKEISRFDSNLSADLNVYYQNVMDIEFKRQYITNCITKYQNGENLTQDETKYVVIYYISIYAEIIESNKRADIIKKDLNNKYDLNVNWPYSYYDVNHSTLQATQLPGTMTRFNSSAIHSHSEST